jgi:hypothetical protein
VIAMIVNFSKELKELKELVKNSIKKQRQILIFAVVIIALNTEKVDGN